MSHKWKKPYKKAPVVRSKDKHHRLPSSRGGTSDPSNISLVSSNVHRAYHQVASNRTPSELAALLNEVWIDPKVEIIVLVRCYEAEQMKTLARRLGILL